MDWVCLLPPRDAQWQWIDKDGKKVFSDQPPPPDLPEKNILRRAGTPPRGRMPVVSAADAAGLPASRAGELEALPPHEAKRRRQGTRGKDAQGRRSRKGQAGSRSAKVAKAKADNCARARQGKATFDSGIRVARMNAKGEREIMDDKARAAESSGCSRSSTATANSTSGASRRSIAGLAAVRAGWRKGPCPGTLCA